MVQPVFRSEGQQQRLDAVNASQMVVTSQTVKEAAKVFFAKKETGATGRFFSAAIVQIDRFMSDYNPIIEVFVDMRGLAVKLAEKLDKIAFQIFTFSKAWDRFFLADAGIFNIIAFFRRGHTFSVSVREANQFWAKCNIGERLDTLSDLSFKAIRAGESLVGFADKVLLAVAFVALSLPIACVGIITSTILAIKALVTAATIERQRLEILGQLRKTNGFERMVTAMTYCERYEAFIDKDNELVLKNFKLRGAEERDVKPFLEARKKWSMTGIFGTKSYPLIFQGFKRLHNELNSIDQQLREWRGAPPTPALADSQIAFLENRKESLIKEGNLWVDKFIQTLATERAQQAAVCIGNLLVVSASIIVLAATLVTIQYWGTAVMVLVSLASAIMLCNSLYSLWQRQRITWQEKEHAISLVTSHFTRQIQSGDLDDKKRLAGAFGLTVEDAVLADDALLKKRFEEHLKTVLHQEKVEQCIDRKFLDAIKEQVQAVGKPISSVQVEKFEQTMSNFFHTILKRTREGERAIQEHLIRISAYVQGGKQLEEKLADTFFDYLRQYCPDVVD